MNKLTVHKWILFVSSYIPLYVVLIIKDVVFRVEKYGIECISRLYTIDSINDVAIIILLLISAISFLYLKIMIKRVKGQAYILVNEVKDETSSHFLNYISIYLLSCIGLTLGTYTDIVTLLLVMIIIGFIYVRSTMIYINPMLNVLNYNIYFLSGLAKGTDEKIDTILIAHKKIKVAKGEILFTTKNTTFVFAINKSMVK